MESHEVIKRACEKTSPKEVASEVGVSLSLVYKWSQPNTDLGSGSRNPLDRVASMVDCTGDNGIIQWLCEQAGGYFGLRGLGHVAACDGIGDGQGAALHCEVDRDV